LSTETDVIASLIRLQHGVILMHFN